MTAREKDPRAWVLKAEHDLLAIRNLVAGSSVPWDIVVFHAQQGAEKYLCDAARPLVRRPDEP